MKPVSLFLRRVAIVYLAFASALSIASENEPVKWYEPVSKFLDENKAMVLISGRIQPGAKIRVNYKEIRSSDGEKVFDAKGGIKYLITEIRAKLSDDAIENGLFELRFPLPFGKVLVPIQIADGEKRHNFLLVFQVNPNEVQIGDGNKVLEESPIFRSKTRLAIGMGMNFLNFSQNEPGVVEDIGFNSLDGPVFLYQVSRWLSANIDSSLSYKSVRGFTKSSESVHVQQGVYSWQTVSGDIDHYPESWKFHWGKKKVIMGYRFGGQYHLIPYLERRSSSDTNVFVKDMEIYQASAGPILKFKLSRLWIFESFMRFQYLINSSSGLNMENGFSFDGSVGFSRKILNKFMLGIYWYGQFIDGSYTHNEPFLDEKTSGELSLLYSNLEARIGINF